MSAGPELLRQDADFALYRVRDGSSDPTVTQLAKVPLRDPPTPACMAQLAHELQLKEALDPGFAAVPLQMDVWRDRPTLFLADPGGVPLETLLHGPMEVGEFLRIAEPLAHALVQMHARGIVHKDLRPANMLVDSHSGAVHLTGFGIAMQPRERSAPPDSVAGTLSYMAPEQTGRMNRSIDARSDLYALGVSMYEMLIGELPFRFDDAMELIHSHMARQPSPPAERHQALPAVLSAMVMKLLQKAAEDRYQTAAGVEADLRACRAQWHSQRRIDAFPLALRDLSPRQLIPQKLYGREPEMAFLADAFRRVAESGRAELVILSGYSGIGKSSLVHELRNVLLPHKALFAGGKFDQFRRDTPYATVAQALRVLVRQVLEEGDVRIREWRERLSAGLGANAALVVKLVPELEKVIGTPPPVPEMPLNEAQNRFRAVLRRFISAFARRNHPLVLFLDDLQWLDSATLQLLEDLAVEPGPRHLLLIGAYRSNEVDAAHALLRALRNVRAARVMPVHEVALEPLTRDDMARLVADALRCPIEHARHLAELVHARSGGNPFFAIQLLAVLAEEGILGIAQDGSGWTWDVRGIQARGATDDIVGLLLGKLGRLPPDTRGVMRLLACLGRQASDDELADLCRQTSEQVHAGLHEAVRAGLVYRSDDLYAFAHDRIEQAAYALVPEDDRAAEHLRIARWLAARMPPDEFDGRIFEIVDQYGRGAGLLTSADERCRVAGYNLHAGRRAKEAMACTEALRYLSSGRDLLGEDGWQQQPVLTFDIEFHLADCEYLTGDLARAEQRLSILTERAADHVQLASVTCARINLHTTQGRTELAVQAGLSYLQQAGILWSQRSTVDDLHAELARMWRQLGQRSIEELVDLPMLDNDASRATMDVLMTMLPPSLFHDQNLAGLIVCRMANIGLEYGHCDSSCIGYAWLGTVLGPRYGDYEAGYRFGRLALDLADRRGLGRYRARVYVHFGNVVIPWSRPFDSGRAWVQRAFDTANENGDLTFAAYSRNHLVTNLLASGTPLGDVQHEAEIGLAFVRKARFGLVADIISAQLQLVRMLRGATARFGSLDGDGFVEADFEERLGNDRALAIAACWYWVRKLQARVIAGDVEGALAAATRAESLLWTSPAHIEVAEFHFYAALARAARCHSPDVGERQALQAALERHATLLDEWATHCPDNFATRAALVAAEIARIEGRDCDAMQAYERAVACARDSGLVHQQALSHELAASFFRARGAATAAAAHLQEACAAYGRWGADGKVKQLEANRVVVPYRPSEEQATPLARLDLLSVVRASQAISRGILLDELADTLMHIVLESAGARDGQLFLIREGAPRLVAEASIDASGTVRVQLHYDRDLPSPPGPASLLDAVCRTQQPVLLADARQPHPYADDPYWSDRSARSVLCLPIVRQSTLHGLLYLENNLVADAFVPQRLAVLDLLATQAAISLENALLYEDVRRENLGRREAEDLLRERESRLRRLVEANIIGVFFWSVRGVVTEANDAFLTLLGREREELLAGSIDWREMTPTEYRDADERALAELRRRGRCAPYEKEYLHRNGSRVPVLIGSAFLEGTQERGVAFVLDLSERRRAEADREARHLAEAATRSKSEFLANMSHEIRTPMNAILGMSHLALQSGLNPQQANYVKKVHRAAESLLGIINDILDFSKIEAGRLDMEQVAFDLSDVFDDLATQVGMKAAEKGLEFVFDIEPGLPDTLVGDPLRLGQILLNLGNNAVKFTERGEVVVKVAEVARDDSSLLLRFEVRDTGIGISEDECERLFQPFSQADASTSRRYGGTGLGLAICAHLVRMMNGEIGVDSHPGQGSRFHFTARIALAGVNSTARLHADHLRGVRVLIADDSEVAREALAHMATAFGMEARAVADGEEALSAMRQADDGDQPFRVLLLDWEMPVLDGIECLERLGRVPLRHPPPTVLMLTAASRDDIQRRLTARRLGPAATLIKPVTPSSLLDACLEALRVERPQRQLGGRPSEARRTIDPDLAGARILLVEDNTINQELAQELLDGAGVHLQIAQNGKEALDRLQHERFDLVLMDCQMPVMDGYAATRALRQQPQLRSLPVIAMTANAMVGDRQKAIEAGMNDHIAKPIRVDDLFATLRRWLAAPEQHGVQSNGVAIDRWAGINNVGGNEALYERVLALFLKREGAFPERLAEALAAQDHETATRLAHDLKCEAATAGMPELERTAASLERACMARNASEIEHHAAQVTAALDPVIEQLRGLLRSA